MTIDFRSVTGAPDPNTVGGYQQIWSQFYSARAQQEQQQGLWVAGATDQQVSANLQAEGTSRPGAYDDGLSNPQAPMFPGAGPLPPGMGGSGAPSSPIMGGGGGTTGPSPIQPPEPGPVQGPMGPTAFQNEYNGGMPMGPQTDSPATGGNANPAVARFVPGMQQAPTVSPQDPGYGWGPAGVHNSDGTMPFTDTYSGG